MPNNLSVERTFEEGTKNIASNGAGNMYGASHTVMNAAVGGQNGFRHKINGADGDGKKVIELYADTKYTSTQIIPILLQYPKGFDFFPNPESWQKNLKHIVEVRPESITGLKSTLTVNFTENRVSGAGEMFSQPVNTLRARTEVVFTWKDIVGRPIQKMLETWIQYLMLDPDTNVPKITNIGSYTTDTWTVDYQSMTMLFIGLDVTHRYVDKAWIVTAMMPKEGGPNEGRRDYSADAEILELPIGFTGVAESTEKVRQFAEGFLADMSYIKTDSDFQELGFEEGMNSIMSEINEEDNHSGFNLNGETGADDQEDPNERSAFSQ